MGRVVSFEDHAVARLRDRLGVAETARDDLLAFARGHSEAVTTIHRAVLHALRCDSLEAMLDAVVRDWPALLEVDLAVVAITVGGEGFLVDAGGVTRLEPALIERAAALPGAVTRAVEGGHGLFGRQARGVRTEALVPIAGGDSALPRGLLLLGHRAQVEPGSTHGAELLEFLGHFLAAMMGRWLMLPNHAPTTTEPSQHAL